MTAPGKPGAFLCQVGGNKLHRTKQCRCLTVKGGYNTRCRTGYFNPCLQNFRIVILRLQSAIQNLMYYEKWVAENTYQSRQNKIYLL